MRPSEKAGSAGKDCKTRVGMIGVFDHTSGNNVTKPFICVFLYSPSVIGIVPMIDYFF